MALRAVFFDVGETLVDEERLWRVLAERSGLQSHVVLAALGVTIERGEDHNALWGHLGIERPSSWNELEYELDDLYPDAIACLEGVCELGLSVGVAGNQTAASSSGHATRRSPSTSSPHRRVLASASRIPGSLLASPSWPDAPRAMSPTSATGSTTTCSRPPRRDSSRFTSAGARGGGCSRRRLRPRSRSTTSRRCRRR